MSGFVYKVRVAGESLIKKEIPGPDTIEEFLYEINALNTLSYSENVINFYGLVVDEYDECVKGLLISYADGGALVDIIYDNCKDKSLGLQWSLKERWARQIVHGLADVHESGFVQGDFTLSNIVIDEKDDAKIIDINRRGCPVGWEPPEATPLIEAGHRISMYIGVKSDLYQLGMVLWALAVEEDEPEREGRPLTFGPKARVPDWYQQVTEICLDPDPRKRLQASMLLHLFPEEHPPPPRISIDDEKSAHSYLVQEFHPDGHPRFPPSDLPSTWWGTGRAYTPTGPPAYQSWHYAQRGRSPPSPLPSNFDDGCDSPQRFHSQSAWASNRDIRPSYSDVGDEVRLDGVAQQLTPCASAEIGPLLPSQDIEGSGVELHSQEPLHLPHPADEGADGRDVQDQITSSTTEPPVTTAHESKDDAAPVDVSKVEEQTPVAEDIPKDQVHAEQQVLDAVGAPNETSPNIQKVETPQDAPKHEHKNACTDPPTTTGPSLDVPTKETSPDVSTKEERCEDAPIVSDVSRKLTEAGGFQPNNAEITENIISLPEAKDSVDGLARSEQKDRTEDSGVPPSENNEDATKSIQTIPKDEEVPMEDKYQNLSESRETIPKDGKDAPSDAKDISTAAGDDTAETNMGPSSTAPNEDGSPVQKDVGTKSASPADAVAETVNPEQSSLDTDNDLPADDSPTKSPDITQAELGTFTNTHMDTPAPDLSSILTPQSDAAEVSSLEPNSITKSAQMSPEDQGGSGTKNAPEVPRNTEPDTEKKSDCIPRLIAFTGAAQTQSEAHSQPIPNDGNVEHTATTTNYDAAPRISPCEKSDAMRVQETLVGIGASHMTIDDNLWREKDLLDEDFHVVAPSDAIPTLIMTTDANT